jgi:hypothetical protein
MNLRSDPDLAITAWLVDEARDGAPERLVESTRRELARTNQRRALWPAWRLNPMNVRIAVAAAAIVVAVAVGYLILPRSTGPSATPTPSPSPTSGPSSPAASTSSATPNPHRLQPFDTTAPALTISATTPASWTEFPSWALISPRDTKAPNGSAIGFLSVKGLYSDPCHWDVDGTRFPSGGDVVVGPTVADLVTAFASQTAYTSTAPIDVSVDGYLGKQLDVQLPSDVDFATCDKLADKPDGDYFLWGTPEASGNNLYAQGPGERRRLRILDVDGTRIVVLNNFYAGTAQADLDEAQAVIDSISITP